jgi:hypothetical protein
MSDFEAHFLDFHFHKVVPANFSPHPGLGEDSYET